MFEMKAIQYVVPFIRKKSFVQFFDRKCFSIMQRYKQARPTEINIERELSNSNIYETRPKDDSERLNPCYYEPIHITRGAIPHDAAFCSWDFPIQPQNPKFLKVGLIGPPNSGKSSLLNEITKCNISAISPKVNTTRNDIRGILTEDETQIVFIDAPGIIPSHKKKFCRELVNAAWRGYEEADLCLLVIDTVKRPTQKLFDCVRKIASKSSLLSENMNGCDGFTESVLKTRKMIQELNNENNSQLLRKESNEIKAAHYHCKDINNEVRNMNEKVNEIEQEFVEEEEEDDEEKEIDTKSNRERNNDKKKIIWNEEKEKKIISIEDTLQKDNHFLPPVVLILNKVDKASHAKWIAARAREFKNQGNFDKVFYVSAKYGRGIDELKSYLFQKAKSGLWIYPKDLKTPLSKVQHVEQLIRTYIFCWFNKDVPYKISQQTIGWTKRLDGTLIIEQELLVKDTKVAKMICGVRNRILFQIRKNVVYKLQNLWGEKVQLFIHVKTMK